MNARASDYLALALYAFAGFGLEILLLMIEPELYRLQVSDWGVLQHCLHWMITSLLWGGISLWLIAFANNRYQFDVYSFTRKPSMSQLLSSIVLVIASITVTFMLNDGIKPLLEFERLRLVKFIFQYVYYLFECVLIVLTIVFGQRLGELLFKVNRLPWGGLFLAVTWGLTHMLTQDMEPGLYAFLLSIVFGILYLLNNKNIKYVYPLVVLIFLL